MGVRVNRKLKSQDEARKVIEYFAAHASTQIDVQGGLFVARVCYEGNVHEFVFRLTGSEPSPTPELVLSSLWSIGAVSERCPTDEEFAQYLGIGVEQARQKRVHWQTDAQKARALFGRYFGVRGW